MKLLIYSFSFILLGFLSSNNSVIVTEKEEKSTQVLKEKELKLTKPENITFQYSIDKHYADSSLRWAELDRMSRPLNGSITNNGKDTVFLVMYSCSDLPGPLEIKPVDKFFDWQLFNCNASWPIICEIAPNEEQKFWTNLQSEGDWNIERLDIYVKFVDRWIDFDTLKKYPELIKSVLYTPYEECSLLEGNQ